MAGPVTPDKATLLPTQGIRWFDRLARRIADARMARTMFRIAPTRKLGRRLGTRQTTA